MAVVREQNLNIRSFYRKLTIWSPWLGLISRIRFPCFRFTLRFILRFFFALSSFFFLPIGPYNIVYHHHDIIKILIRCMIKNILLKGRETIMSFWAYDPIYCSVIFIIDYQNIFLNVFNLYLLSFKDNILYSILFNF